MITPLFGTLGYFLPYTQLRVSTEQQQFAPSSLKGIIHAPFTPPHNGHILMDIWRTLGSLMPSLFCWYSCLASMHCLDPCRHTQIFIQLFVLLQQMEPEIYSSFWNYRNFTCNCSSAGTQAPTFNASAKIKDISIITLHIWLKILSSLEKV